MQLSLIFRIAVDLNCYWERRGWVSVKRRWIKQDIKDLLLDGNMKGIEKRKGKYCMSVALSNTNAIMTDFICEFELLL